MTGVWEMTDEREYKYRLKWFPGFSSGGESRLAEKLTSGGSHWWDFQGNEKYTGKTFQLDPLIRSWQSFCVIYGRSCEGVQFSCSFLTATSTPVELWFQAKYSYLPREKTWEQAQPTWRSLGGDDIGKKNNKCVRKKARKQKKQGCKKVEEKKGGKKG